MVHTDSRVLKYLHYPPVERGHREARLEMGFSMSQMGSVDLVDLPGGYFSGF